jgi:hypothetical protein
MIEEPCPHPDLLHRFVPTPYVFSKGDGSSVVCVQSNDLEIALGVRRSGIDEHYGKGSRGLFCKLIRDMAAPVDGSGISIISDGVLRVLQMGRGTILIHDSERSELLGFISRNVKTQELVSLLIPAVLNA